MTAKSKSDHLSEIAADRLAARVRNYWAARGYSIHTWSEYIAGPARGEEGDSDRRGHWQVRSDMRGGLPVRPSLSTANVGVSTISAAALDQCRLGLSRR